MKRLLIITLLAIGLSAPAGCYRYSMTARDVKSDGEKHLARGTVFFWGLVGTRRYAKCNGKPLAKISTFQPWWSPLVSTLTFGIVTPWRSSYQCAAVPAAPEGPEPEPEPIDADADADVDADVDADEG